MKLARQPTDVVVDLSSSLSRLPSAMVAAFLFRQSVTILGLKTHGRFLQHQDVR